MQFIQGINRHQTYFTTVDEQIGSDNAVRLIDVFIDKLDLVQLGFMGTIHKSESLILLDSVVFLTQGGTVRINALIVVYYSQTSYKLGLLVVTNDWLSPNTMRQWGNIAAYERKRLGVVGTLAFRLPTTEAQ